MTLHEFPMYESASVPKTHRRKAALIALLHICISPDFSRLIILNTYASNLILQGDQCVSLIDFFVVVWCWDLGE